LFLNSKKEIKDMAHPPEEILSKEIIAALRSYAAEAEALKTLPDAVCELIREQRWYQVLVPEQCGGLEYSLPEAVALFEALAYAEANTGWCVNLGAGANMFSGYLSLPVSRAIFNNVATCCAGSGAISGTALKTEGGYRLSGRWKYASGADQATHFTANAYLLEADGSPVMEGGQQVFRSFIIPSGKVHNYHNWDAVGLKATSSNDFGIADIFVPEEQVFTLLKPSGFAAGTVYQFPFHLLASINMTCMITGIALHFEEEYRILAAVKKPLHANAVLSAQPQAQAILERASGRFHRARTEMYLRLQELWLVYEKGGEAMAEEITLFKQANKEAAAASRQLIADLFPLCGLSSVSESSALNKIWRDAAVAGQHYLLSPLYE